jgi:hypothetical protein
LIVSALVIAIASPSSIIYSIIIRIDHHIVLFEFRDIFTEHLLIFLCRKPNIDLSNDNKGLIYVLTVL